MTRISSISGTRPIISRIARRTIGPTVSSSLSVGRTRETVTPCFSFSWTRRRRSPNSAWWKRGSLRCWRWRSSWNRLRWLQLPSHS